MTKPAVPPPARGDIVEIDAMDVAEWESGQRTPQAHDANLAELVRKTAAPPEPEAYAQTVARSRRQTGAQLIPRPTRTTRGLDVPAGPAVESQRSPAPMTSNGIDFSLPVTATGESGARPPEPEPLPPIPATSPFAEPSQAGPGRNASPAGSADPNTAWPPRPIPADASLQPARRAAPDAAILPPGRDDAAGADRVKVALTRGRLWWIGGGLAAASLAGVVAAALLPDPDALPPQLSEDRREPPAAPAQPLDRTGAQPRDPGRPARPGAPEPAVAATGAATAPAAAVAVDRRTTQPTSTALDTSRRIRPAASAAAPRPRRAEKKPAARKLVVDYTARPNETPPPSLVAQSEEDPAIGKARSAYSTGNQRLFAGDLDGAIRAYRQSLELYPGYVGGYRGLGLAYEELGDTASALAAFRAYVAAVPGARDTALIKKRIAHLQRR